MDTKDYIMYKTRILMLFETNKQECKEYCYQVLRQIKKLKLNIEVTSLRWQCYFYIAKIFNSFNNHKIALAYVQKSLEYATEKSEKANSIWLQANLYERIDIEKSSQLYDEAIKVCQTKIPSKCLADIIHNKAVFENNSDAMEKAIDIYEQLNVKETIVDSAYMDLFYIYLSKNYFLLAQKIVIKIKDIDMRMKLNKDLFSLSKSTTELQMIS